MYRGEYLQCGVVNYLGGGGAAQSTSRKGIGFFLCESVSIQYNIGFLKFRVCGIKSNDAVLSLKKWYTLCIWSCK